MEKDVREAVNELLSKIPEDKLAEAAGGLDDSTKATLKKGLILSGLFAAGVGAGVGSTVGVQKLRANGYLGGKKVEGTPSSGASDGQNSGTTPNGSPQPNSVPEVPQPQATDTPQPQATADPATGGATE